MFNKHKFQCTKSNNNSSEYNSLIAFNNVTHSVLYDYFICEKWKN